MNRILIVRTSAIGDVVFATPFAEALRRARPDAHIAWVVDAALAPLIANDPALNEVISWPKERWSRAWRERRFRECWRDVAAFRRDLRSRNFDTAIDLQGLLKSGLLARWSGATRRIGLGSREGSQWLMTEVHPRGGDKTLIGSEYRFLAERLDLPTDAFIPRLSTSQETDARVLSLLASRGLLPGNYAVLAPFTTRPQKHWFEDAWRDLAPKVRGEFGLAPVMLGGPNDKEAAARIATPQSGIISLAGQTSLVEAASLVKHCALLIGVDTGLTHMGTAFARPTIGIFGSTCPYKNVGRASTRVIWLGLECSPCRHHPTCNGAFTCLRNITPGMVMEQARMVVATGAAA